jgi:hypothetical protein
MTTEYLEDHQMSNDEMVITCQLLAPMHVVNVCAFFAYLMINTSSLSATLHYMHFFLFGYVSCVHYIRCVCVFVYVCVCCL